MKPINLRDSGCDPISSNCIVWQGPDIECISLCKGDSVSDVVYKMATELCTILAQLDVETYDISCLNLADCGPKDFKTLMNLLLEKVCALNDLPASGGSTTGSSSEIIVNTCESFHYLNETGDLITSMPLDKYVAAIGNKVCNIAQSIVTINETLSNHNTRISTLENATSTEVSLPVLSPTCVIGGANIPLVDVLTALETQFCELRTYTGNTQDISQAMQRMCSGLSVLDKLSGSGTYGADPNFIGSPSNMANSVNNLWNVVCDMRSAVNRILTTCCITDCNSIDLQVTGELSDSSTLVLSFGGTIPNDYIDAVQGSTIEITDSFGGGPQILSAVAIKGSHFDPVTDKVISLSGVSGTGDVTVKVTYRFQNSTDQSVCQDTITTVILGADSCPTLTLTPAYTELDYGFTWAGTTPTFITVELWNSAETALIQSSTLNVTTSNQVGQFQSLTEGTDYKIRLKIGDQYCNYQSVTTLSYACVAAELSAPGIIYNSPEGDQDGNTITSWITAYDIAHP